MIICAEWISEATSNISQKVLQGAAAASLTSTKQNVVAKSAEIKHQKFYIQ
jgi:hypothetical protein